VVVAAKLLHSKRHDLDEMKSILHNVVARGYDGAKYFNLILKVLTKDGFSRAEVLPLFQDLFTRQRLTYCRWAIMNVDDRPSFWECHWTRFLLLEFEYRPICFSDGTCEVYG